MALGEIISATPATPAACNALCAIFLFFCFCLASPRSRGRNKTKRYTALQACRRGEGRLRKLYTRVSLRRVMLQCGVLSCTRVLRFAWRQSYRDLLPPAATAAYVRGQLRPCDPCGGGGVPVVVESPSDAAGVYAFAAQPTALAVRALCEVARPAPPPSLTERARALARLAAVLRENAALLASADALVTGMCLRDARLSLSAALDFIAVCEQRLRTPQGEPTTTTTEDAVAVAVHAGEVLHSHGYGEGECHTDLHAGDASTGRASVALCMTAAHYPLQWGMEAVAIALLRGSAAVWLPSLETPLSALWLMHLLHCGGRNVVADPRAAVHIILCRSDEVVAAFMRQQEEGFSVVGLTNGFREQQLYRLPQLLGAAPMSCDAGASWMAGWHHRVMKPSLAMVGASPCCTDTVAARICQYAFHGNGRRLYALQIVFVPQQDILLVLRSVAQYVRGLRLGHSLDPTADMGPLPAAAHMAAMKDTVEAAVCCGEVKLQHVCGGFEVAMPAGYFCLPCAFYSSIANVTPAATEASLNAVLATTARLRGGLDRLGGGPFVIVCGYDPPQQGKVLENVLRDASSSSFAVHHW
ncbi:hypothetical protein TRSC58_04230 [Trypanosoma rangeli SC58]|uniref:Aldehyde dehydrogenase domain-containing protein n=1 Tax=Trypanosoma rangeli SC58 TaxID=429131 RepID=A0A061J1B7_TRYRA|nr:hypothetical protein TRSC58_04230 [Trypanosoma rangeli SC58]